MTKVISPLINCQKCKRLVKFRNENKKKHSTWHNAPVPSFGKINMSCSSETSTPMERLYDGE